MRSEFFVNLEKIQGVGGIVLELMSAALDEQTVKTCTLNI